MATRRTFLGSMAAGLSAAVAHRAAHAAGAAKPPLGLQLWSVRKACERDLAGTLRQIKAWGIDEVELADYHGRTAAELGAELRRAGLRCQAMHVDFDRLKRDLAGVLKDAEAIGATYVVNPHLPQEREGPATREEILEAAGVFRRWAKQCEAAGRRFAHHLHGQEFGPAPEGTLFDVLAKESGPAVGFEFDVFWIVWGGADPVRLMERHPGRVWFTHLKDMAKGTMPGKKDEDLEKANVVLGTGMIDIAGVVRRGAKAGVRIHYLEDESLDPAAQIPKSVAYYHSLRL
jgi:sugar phosphate isomerase/epimerase